MTKLFDISSEFSFYLLLGFILLIPFSIAVCYLLFTFLSIQMIGHWVINRRKNRHSLPAMPNYYRYFLFYILATLISTLFSINRLHSFKDNKEVFIYLLIPLFLLVISRLKRLHLSLIAVLTAAVGSALWGIIDAIIRGISLDHRLHGATSHWMTYAGLLMVPFIFFFVYLFHEPNKRNKVVISVSLVIILTAIALSLTRSMWVGIFVSCGLFLVYYKPRILYFAVPALILSVLILPSSVKSRVTSIFDMNNETNRDRIYMATIAFNIFKDHPLTGVGPNNIEHVYNQYKPPGAKLTNMHLHNNFLHVLAERGAPALIILMIAFLAVISGLIKKIKRGGPYEKIISTAVLFAFTGFLIAGMFEYNYGDSEVKFQLFYFLSLPFLPFMDNSVKSGEPEPESLATQAEADDVIERD